jgi:hypothetical protein
MLELLGLVWLLLAVRFAAAAFIFWPALLGAGVSAALGLLTWELAAARGK